MKKLQEGDVIELVEGMEVYANVPEHFVYSNCRGSYELTRHDIKIGGNFDYFVGKYIVYKTTYDGGSSGGGMNGHDDYPNGHHVFCVKVDNPKIKVDFYQSGCFTAMIENIKPIGKAKQTWTVE